ncbi:MAG: sialidase family protein, partial [Verrucomicrobiota bacterium]
HDAGGDPDGDGLINFREHLIGTSPVLADTDGDGLNDLLDYELTFNVPVNSAAQDHGKEQNTQFEPTCAVLNGNVIVAYVDSNRGVYELGSTNNSQGYLSGYTPRMAGYSVSQFGGAFFDDKDVPPLSTQGAGTSDDGDAGDPVLAVDSSSNALVYLVATSPRNAGHKGIPFWKSTNGGLTFGTPSLIAGNVTLTDKPWIAVDNFPGVNDGQGTVYVAFATMSAPGKLWLCSSVDRGTNWSSALPIAEAESGGVINCALPVVCSDHSLAVFWYERFANGQSHLRLRKVTNRSNLSAVYPASGNNTLRLNTQDYRLLLRRTENGSTSDTFTAYPFPVPAASPDTNRAGHLYLTWADKGSGSDRADVFFSRSINGGQTWTVPVRLSTTAFNDQWMPVLAVKSDGTKLFAAWYDRRNDPNNSLMELYGRWATVNGDGSVTWGTEFKITTTSFPPVFAGYLPVNRDPGKYDPVYPPSDVNLNWHYPEWPLVDDLGLPVVTSLAYTGHVGEYNFCIGDGPHVHLVWTDYRDLTANTIAVRNQANIRYSRLTW